MHPNNLRSTTDAQRKAIEQTEQNFSTNGQATLQSTVAGWDGYEGDDLAVQFIYTYNDDPDGPTGLEVTVFDANGKVTGSQDFG